jgi:hypothetical protein
MLVGNVLICYVSGENLTRDFSLSLISLFYVSLSNQSIYLIFPSGWNMTSFHDSICLYLIFSCPKFHAPRVWLNFLSHYLHFLDILVSQLQWWQMAIQIAHASFVSANCIQSSPNQILITNNSNSIWKQKRKLTKKILFSLIGYR